MNNKWIQMFFYLCFSALFLFSLYTKILEIATFEVSLFASNIPLKFTEIVARLILISEFVLGLWLFLSVFTKDKKPLLLAFLLILFFDFFLLKELFMGDSKENCGCFGDILKMTTEQALIKNVLTQFLMIPFLLWQTKTKFFRWITGVLLLTGVTAYIMVSYPIVNVFEVNENQVTRVSLENTGLDKMTPSLKELMLIDKQFLVFVHYGCGHCKDFVKYLDVINEKKMLPQTRVVLYGDQKKIDSFLAQTEMKLPYSVIEKEEHLKTCKGQFPSVFLVANDSLYGRWGRTDFEPREILRQYAK